MVRDPSLLDKMIFMFTNEWFCLLRLCVDIWEGMTSLATFVRYFQRLLGAVTLGLSCPLMGISSAHCYAQEKSSNYKILPISVPSPSSHTSELLEAC